MSFDREYLEQATDDLAAGGPVDFLGLADALEAVARELRAAGDLRLAALADWAADQASMADMRYRVDEDAEGDLWSHLVVVLDLLPEQVAAVAA